MPRARPKNKQTDKKHRHSSEFCNHRQSTPGPNCDTPPGSPTLPLRSWLYSPVRDLTRSSQLLRLAPSDIFDPSLMTHSQLVNRAYSTTLSTATFPPQLLAQSIHTSYWDHELASDDCVSSPCSLRFISCSYFPKGQPVPVPFLLKKNLLSTLQQALEGQEHKSHGEKVDSKGKKRT